MSNGKQYYGAYFWITLVSFAVPIFVGWKAFENLSPTTKPVPQLDASGVDHAVWDYLLKSYVSYGLVDYDGMKKDYLFREYLGELGACNPNALETDDDKLALACNAYNAFVIDGIIGHDIRDTCNGFEQENVGFFDLKEHIFAGQTMSLNDLEHGKIRPEFRDPRIHVALVCAARSCPAIRGEAYIGERIQTQLDDQSKLFANNPKYVNYDSESNTLLLSQILKWYGEDWDAKYPNGGYLEWLAGLVDKPAMKVTIEEAIRKQVTVGFSTYDWTLNSQAEPGAKQASSKKSGGFGSGSSPDE